MRGNQDVLATAEVVTLVFQAKDAAEMNKVPPAGVNDAWEKRQAIQIAALLPEDRNAALRVLAHARELVEGWWGTP